MELIFLLLTIVGIIVAVIFGYLQVVVPFIKGEVRFSKRFPFVETAEAVVGAKPHRRKKKKRKRFLIPGLAIGILIVLFVLIRFLVFQAKAIERVPIAVINFTNHTGDEQFDYLCAAIPNLLITNLEQSKHLSVLTWERMRDLLKVLGKEHVHAVDEDLGFEICNMDDIQAIVTGSFTKAGNVFVTEVKVLDVASKEILKTSSSQGEGVASILKIQIDELSQAIARSVSLYERVAAPTEMQIMEVTTTSMEAYNYYVRGLEERRNWNFDDARKFLEKAVELDSMFASAYLYLSWTCAWLLDYESARRAREMALALADRATEKERLYIQAWYEEDLEKHFRILEQLVKKYPKEKNVHVLLGNHYADKEQPHRAIEEYNKVLELDPNHGETLNLLAYMYADIGDYAKAIEYLKRYAAVEPGRADPFDSMGDLYFRMGQLDEALAKYKEAIFVGPDFSYTSGKIAYIYALREDYAEAMKWVDHYVTTAPSPGIRAAGYSQKAFYNYLLGDYLSEKIEWKHGSELVVVSRAKIYYDQGKLDLSRDHYKALRAEVSDNPYGIIVCNYYIGLIEVRQNSPDSTRARLALIKPLLSDVVPYFRNHALLLHDLLYAEVLLAQDSVEKSITVFEKASEFEVQAPPWWIITAMHMPYDNDVVARAYLKKGNVDRAILEYERLTDPDPNKRGRCLIRPTWRYELAKLCEQKGLKAKAVGQYERFLDIWKNADENRPEKIDAKKRLAKLK